MSLDGCSFRGICVRPLSMLIVAKQDVESGLFGMPQCEVGWFLMWLLTGDRSVTKSMWPPVLGQRRRGSTICVVR